MNLTLDYHEILRYLGHWGQKVDQQTESLILRCMEEIQQAAKPRYFYQIYNIRCDIDNEAILLPECGLTLPGRDLYEHLRQCRKCAVMAATLGIEADNLIRVAENTEMSRAVVLDACATEMVEKLCDAAELEIAQIAARENRGLQSRFSPGYGDCPLSLQKEIGRVLDTARKIGLTITENALMIPRKSVTAFVGFTTQIKKKKTNPCATCSMGGRCRFRKEGTTCGR